MKGILVALILTGCAGGWTKGDYAMGVGLVGITTIDWRQTRRYIATPTACDEANVVIGQCGQRVPPDLYFPVMTVLQLGLAAILPHGSWRTAALGLAGGIELGAVETNVQDGTPLW